MRRLFGPGALAAVAVLLLACDKKESRTASVRDPDTATASETASSAPPGSTSYVGLAYDTPPQGVRALGGAILSDPDGTPGNYSFTHVSTPRGEMIWLDTVNTSTRRVLAELSLPPMAPDERLFISSCDVGGRLDPRTIAIVITEPDVVRYTKIRQAWRVDLRAARFDLMPVKGIVCEDPGS